MAEMIGRAASRRASSQMNDGSTDIVGRRVVEDRLCLRVHAKGKDRLHDHVRQSFSVWHAQIDGGHHLAWPEDVDLQTALPRSSREKVGRPLRLAVAARWQVPLVQRGFLGER